MAGSRRKRPPPSSPDFVRRQRALGSSASRSRASSSEPTPTISSSWPSRSATTEPVDVRYRRRRPLRPGRPAGAAYRFRQGASQPQRLQDGLAQGRHLRARAGGPGPGQLGVRPTSAAHPAAQAGRPGHVRVAASITPIATALLDQLRRRRSRATARTRTSATTGGAPSTCSTSRLAPSCSSCPPTCPAGGQHPIPGASGVEQRDDQGHQPGHRHVPPQTVVAQLWVKDNKAQEVDLDLNQFIHTVSLRRPASDP